MKNYIYDRTRRIIFLILLYIMALGLSVVAIVVYPLARQKMFYLKHASEVAEKYIEGNSNLPLWMDGRTKITIYKSDKSLAYDASTDNDFMKKISCEPFVEKVLSGESAFALETAEGTTLIGEGLYGIAGVPIEHNGEIIGAAFYIRKIIAVLESAMCFAIFFTILYWLSAYFIISSILKQRQLEEERQLYIDNFTHALKTPVASVKVLSEALCDGMIKDPLKLQMYYGLILNETTKQSRMIHQILELSKLQSRRTDMSKKCVSAKELFGSVIERYIKLADLVEIKMRADEKIFELPDMFTNVNGINEIFQIILDNALKYIPAGKNIWVEAVNTGKHAEICIRDDGPGIPAGDLPHIFERFYRGNNSEGSESSGLGLAIAHEIIMLLGEKIRVESKDGEGTAFYFTIGF